MITGYVCAFITLILLLKALGRKLQLPSLNAILRRVHLPLGFVILFVIAGHLIFTLPVWKQRSILVVVSGIITAVLFLWMLITYRMRGRWKKVWLRYHRVGAAWIGILLVFHVVVYFIDFGAYQSKITNIQLQGMTAEGIADGTYYGECDAGYIYAKVEVVVAKEKMQEIRLLTHNNERGKKAEALVPIMEREQTTKVDAVSGATNSSKVIRKAVENALRSGKKLQN